MKNKIFAAVIAALAFTANLKAQSTAYASTTATLVAPIAISKTTDMNFGTLAASGTAGTVVLDYADGRTYTGGVTLLTGSSAEKTAVFSVSGEGTSSFSISIPDSPITLTGSVSGTMTVGSFVCDLGTSGTLVAGSKTAKVKATLNVGANQPAGTYTKSGDSQGLFVTVNYN